MKKKIKWLLLICLFTMILLPTAVRASDEAVIQNDATGIPDKTLYRKIAEYLRKPENELFTEGEAAEIISFKSDFGDVQDLTGIEYLKNLRKLEIRYTNLESLKSLKDLKALRILEIQYGRIASLEGIEELKNLEILGLENNRLVSLEGIKESTGLEYLNVGWNRLTSLKGIEGLTKLDTLYAEGNEIRDIHPIAGLTNLEQLKLGDNEINDASEIENLSKLKVLDLGYNRLKKIPNLKGMANLKKKNESEYLDPSYLDVRGNRLSEKEVKKKLKPYLGKKTAVKWLDEQILVQRNYTFRLTKPKNMKKITPKTTKISGVVKRTGSAKQPLFISIRNKFGDIYGLKVKADKKGRFTFHKKALKKAGFKNYMKNEKTLYFGIYIKSDRKYMNKRDVLIESIPFPVETEMEWQ